MHGLYFRLLYPQIFVQTKLCFKFARSNAEQACAVLSTVAYGVIGNTAGFGPVVLGSSPSRPTLKALDFFEIKSFFYFLVKLFIRTNKGVGLN